MLFNSIIWILDTFKQIKFKSIFVFVIIICYESETVLNYIVAPGNAVETQHSVFVESVKQGTKSTRHEGCFYSKRSTWETVNEG